MCVLWLNVYFSPVLVIRPHFLETARLCPEAEVVSENWIIILENGSDFALILTCEVEFYRFVFLDVSFRMEIEEWPYAEMPCHSLDC